MMGQKEGDVDRIYENAIQFACMQPQVSKIIHVRCGTELVSLDKGKWTKQSLGSAARYQEYY